MSEMLTIVGEAQVAIEPVELELQAIQAESIGWIAIGGEYLHVGDTEDQVIEVVGLATASMAGANVLWLG
jgi:hypothetical protein